MVTQSSVSVTPEKSAHPFIFGNRSRIAAYYFLGAASLAAVALSVGGVSRLLLWPTTGLVAIGLSYLGVLRSPYGKVGGKIPLFRRFWLAPMILAQRLSLVYSARKTAPWHALLPQVWIGRSLDDLEAATAISQGVTSVLDLSSELDEAGPFTQIDYLHLPVLDFTAPTLSQFKEAMDFISNGSRDGIVYIHGKAGYARTAAIAGYWLLHAQKVQNPQAALRLAKARRPNLVPQVEVMHALESIRSDAFENPSEPSVDRGVDPTN